MGSTKYLLCLTRWNWLVKLDVNILYHVMELNISQAGFSFFSVPINDEHLDSLNCNVFASFSVISGFQSCNRYEVKNAMGHWIYFAAEENDDFNMNCYGPLRSFTIKLFDSTNQPVMQVSREFHCSSCCCPCICCLQELEVQAPLGNIIGYVKQNWHPCLPKFTIQNEARENVLKITAPCVPCQCYQDVNFEVKTVDGKSTIGNIVKKWTGLAREVATDASIFQIRFPMDLDINMKAIITGACFLMVSLRPKIL
uniref:Phospholipid scramblase n=1 Tax=Naja naja TaxID=35670 RepID=A0A8C6XXT2_NAJNA